MFVTLLAIGIGLAWVTPVNACQLCSNTKELKQSVCMTPVVAVYENAEVLSNLDYKSGTVAKAELRFNLEPMPYIVMEKCRFRFSKGRNFVSANNLFNYIKPVKYLNPVGQVPYRLRC